MYLIHTIDLGFHYEFSKLLRKGRFKLRDERIFSAEGARAEPVSKSPVREVFESPEGVLLRIAYPGEHTLTVEGRHESLRVFRIHLGSMGLPETLVSLLTFQLDRVFQKLSATEESISF